MKKCSKLQQRSCKFRSDLKTAYRKTILSVNIFLTLWLLVFRASDHESETILFQQRMSVPEEDHLYQGFFHLSCVTEYRSCEVTTPTTFIFKAVENCLLSCSAK